MFRHASLLESVTRVASFRKELKSLKAKIRSSILSCRLHGRLQMFCLPSGNVEFPIGRGSQLSQSTTSAGLPSRPGCGAQCSRWRMIGCAAGLLPMLPPGDMCVCSRASHGFSLYGYLPAFSNGFTSRRAVFDALTWPPGWASNVPLRCISELRSLGDQLVWLALVGLPPERLATGRLPSVRTAGNADIRSGLGQQDMLPRLQYGGSCLQCELRMRVFPLGIQGATVARVCAGAATCRGPCARAWTSISRVHEERKIAETSEHAWASVGVQMPFRDSCASVRQQQTAQGCTLGILENGKRTAHLMLTRSHCDVLITGRSPSDQLRHPICTEVSDSGCM